MSYAEVIMVASSSGVMSPFSILMVHHGCFPESCLSSIHPRDGMTCFGMYGMEVRCYHFLFQLCTTYTAACPSHTASYHKAIRMSSGMIVTHLACMV